MSITQQIYGAFTKLNFVKTYLLLLVLTVVLLFFISWPGAILAAAITGLFVRHYSRAALVGFLGGLTAWGLLTGIHLAFGGIAILNLFGAIAGLEGLGGVLAAIIILLGGVLGLAGSLLGNAIFGFVEHYFVENTETTG